MNSLSPDKGYKDDNIGKAIRSIEERIKDHNIRDKISHLLTL